MASVMSSISDSAELGCIESKAGLELAGTSADIGCVIPEVAIRLLVPAQYQLVWSEFEIEYSVVRRFRWLRRFWIFLRSLVSVIPDQSSSFLTHLPAKLVCCAVSMIESAMMEPIWLRLAWVPTVRC